MRLIRGLPAALEAFARRTPAQVDPLRRERVEAIIAEVRAGGDAALRAMSLQLDGVALGAIEVSAEERRTVAAGLPAELRAAIDLAIERVRAFHLRQPSGGFLDAGPDGLLGQLVQPLRRVGCYVPAGTAPLPSSLIMTAVPALVAGVEEVVVASPPRPSPGDGRESGVDAAVLYVAEKLGLSAVYALGGAQAIAALAYGTESVRPVDKVVGPGSAWVVIAKALVFGQVGIESLPGPTETLVIADAEADPVHVAADLLAQAEHDEAVPVLVSDDAGLWPRVEAELERQLADLPTAEAARASLRERGMVVEVADLAQAVEAANAFAPEHLCLLVREPWSLVGSVRNAGALFVGPHSPEALGDYVAGPSHVMPTGGTARFASAVNLRDFQRVVPLVALNEAALAANGPAGARLARAEGLEAHARAIEARLPKAAAKDGEGPRAQAEASPPPGQG